MRFLFSLFLFGNMLCGLCAQDTFSIVAVDTTTGEVGSAGASCVDLNSFPGFEDDFLGELFPGVGAINTQAFYLGANQAGARNRMNLGDTPAQIIQWLIQNDFSGNPELRQYGIAAIVDGQPQAAGYTGSGTDDYKNHVTGPNYSIQGNILLGQEILDSMEARFLRAEGDLACRLMAALQGANVVGADTRCTPLGTSSLFAFVKVAQVGDSFGDPSFKLSVRSSGTPAQEPIDQLQLLFDNEKSCEAATGVAPEVVEDHFALSFMNQGNAFMIEGTKSTTYQVTWIDLTGRQWMRGAVRQGEIIDLTLLPRGIWVVQLTDGQRQWTTKILK
ncbi:MAG: DUF1028 domain-containing protein [Bacteroidota bacterium]